MPIYILRIPEIKANKMGLNIGTFNSKSIIDTQALTRVTQQILNPDKEAVVDVSKLDLTKFNRVSLGTDLYSARVSTETAIQTAKAAVDFDVNLSKAFSSNVQYLNSVAAQSLFTAKEAGKIGVENTQNVETSQAVKASSNIEETSNLNKDRRGSNPFSFYISKNDKNEQVDFETADINTYSGINFFA